MSTTSIDYPQRVADAAPPSKPKARVSRRLIKRLLVSLAALAIVFVAGYVGVEAREFDASMDKIYDLPVPAVVASRDPVVIARGRHVVESVAACAASDCHAADLGGGRAVDMGPLGTFAAPNITPAGLGATYADGELARLLRHGIKKNGTSVRFIPAQDFGWIPDDDVIAVVSYVRSVPPVDRPNGASTVNTLAKVLDRRGSVIIDVARHIDHTRTESVSAPAPTPDYGRFLGRACTGCHGENLSGGAMPIPLNLTPDGSGLAGWTYDDFDRLLTTGVRKNGQRLNRSCPTSRTESSTRWRSAALFAFLQSLPAREFGGR